MVETELGLQEPIGMNTGYNTSATIHIYSLFRGTKCNTWMQISYSFFHAYLIVFETYIAGTCHPTEARLARSVSLVSTYKHATGPNNKSQEQCYDCMQDYMLSLRL